MLKKTKKGFYVLQEWVSKEGLAHAFSTRKFGNLRVVKSLEENKKIDQFLAILGLKKTKLVLMEQVHGDKIKIVSQDDEGQVLPGIDGLITCQKEIVLGIKTADCLPILLADLQKKIIAAVHAGWRGVLNRITQKATKKMISLGARAENILVGIGPHIRSCCYGVSQGRVNQFKKEFGDLAGMVSKEKRGFSLDLAIPAVAQLIKTGITRQNIALGSECTACKEKDFFSSRREGEKHGSLLSIISLF